MGDSGRGALEIWSDHYGTARWIRPEAGAPACQVSPEEHLDRRARPPDPAEDPADAAPPGFAAAMQLDPALPMQRGAVGLEFFGVGVDSLEVLENLERTTERLRVPPRGGLVTSISRTTGLDCDDRARMFFESGGVREDPTTGSANSIACRCLHAVSSLPLPMDPITPG